MKRLTTIALLLAAVTLTLSGCGSRNVPLGGTVTFEDGSPLTTGTVTFVRADGQHQARGEIGADGRFDLGFLGVKDGLPKGEYRVSVSASKSTITKKSGLTVFGKTEQLLDEKFEHPSTSGLTCNVDGSGKTFDIKVSKPAKPRISDYYTVLPPNEAEAVSK